MEAGQEIEVSSRIKTETSDNHSENDGEFTNVNTKINFYAIFLKINYFNKFLKFQILP